MIRDYILLGIGTLLIALAVKEYLIPCQIVTGSVSGLALLFNEVLGIDPFDESFLSFDRHMFSGEEVWLALCLYFPSFASGDGPDTGV